MINALVIKGPLRNCLRRPAKATDRHGKTVSGVSASGPKPTVAELFEHSFTSVTSDAGEDSFTKRKAGAGEGKQERQRGWYIRY